MFIEMTVDSVTIDNKVNTPVVTLKGGESILPIWIGLLEASSIASELEGLKLTRPMTHDLLRNSIETLGGEITKIEIKDLKDSVYYSSIHIKKGTSYIEIDSRPSDAIALSLRVGLPIFVEEGVIEKSSTLKGPTMTQNKIVSDDIEQSLKDLPAEAFNKYKI